jgi:hypothetical protein
VIFFAQAVSAFADNESAIVGAVRQEVDEPRGIPSPLIRGRLGISDYVCLPLKHFEIRLFGVLVLVGPCLGLLDVSSTGEEQAVSDDLEFIAQKHAYLGNVTLIASKETMRSLVP